MERVCAFSRAQFRDWTEDEFLSRFRRMLTLEQYRDPEMARMYDQYLSAGPVGYLTDIFRPLAASPEEARLLALEFYGPMFLLYSVYDGADEKESIAPMLSTHIDRFIAKIESCYRKSGTSI